MTGSGKYSTPYPGHVSAMSDASGFIALLEPGKQTGNGLVVDRERSI